MSQISYCGACAWYNWTWCRCELNDFPGCQMRTLNFDASKCNEKSVFVFSGDKMRDEQFIFGKTIRNQIWFAIINGQKTIILIDDVDKDSGYLFSCFESPISHWSEKDCDSFELVKRVEWPKE